MRRKLKYLKYGKILKRLLKKIISLQLRIIYVKTGATIKPICPLFNDDAPNTDSLQKIEDRILELNETLEAVNMFENQNELPDSSPLKEVDVKKLNEELDLLNIEKNSLLDDITKLLGK